MCYCKQCIVQNCQGIQPFICSDRMKANISTEQYIYFFAMLLLFFKILFSLSTWEFSYTYEPWHYILRVQPLMIFFIKCSIPTSSMT